MATQLNRAALIVLAAASAGCTQIAEHRVDHELTVIGGDFALYRQCLESRGGSCPGDAGTPLPQSTTAASQVAPIRAGLAAQVAASVAALPAGHAAQAASSVLQHPLVQKLAAVHNHVRGLPPPVPVAGVEVGAADADADQTLSLTTSPEETSDFLDQIHQTTASGGWRALADHAGKQAAALGPAAGAEADEARQDARTAAFIRRYFDAYFENGKFVKLELDTQDLDAKVDRYLSRSAPLFCGDPEQASTYCDPLVSSVQNDLLKGVARDSSNQSFVLLAMGTTGYLSRTGQRFAFPGVDVTFDPAGSHPVSVARIDLTQVGTDLVWVFFQAFFDAHEGLPAVSNATGVDLGAADQAFDLPVFDPGAGQVDQQDFQTIVTFSNQVGGAVGAAFDKAIRGIGPLSLGNEALETALTAIVTVTVEDAAQKAAWCWYSCGLDRQLDEAGAEAKSKLHAGIDKEAKRIKMRWRLS
jgi:hypothetical protein